jgi:CRISPR-associated exonuclease Cas4
MLLYLALFFLLASAVLFWLATRRQRASGLPGGRIIYSDMRTWGAVEKPLYDASLGLTGRPDYLIEKGDLYIPVEVKSSKIPSAPYDSHIFQVAAYCLLVERALGKRPPYGIIHYQDRSGGSQTFSVEYTRAIETATLDIIADLRTQDRRKEVERSHEAPERCACCGYRSLCDQSLA